MGSETWDAGFLFFINNKPQAAAFEAFDEHIPTVLNLVMCLILIFMFAFAGINAYLYHMVNNFRL